MLEAKTIYNILIYGVSIIPITLGAFLLLFAIPKNQALKPYLLSRKALAIAYLAMGILNILKAVVMGDQLGEDSLPFNFKMANVSLIIASCQAYLFTYALIILIDPHFASLRWNKYQWCIISICSVGIISGLFLDLLIWQHIVFALFLAFYIYQLIYYTWLFLDKKKSYISKVDNYFSGQEIHWMKWIDLAFYSALVIGISALFMVVFNNMWFRNIFSLACCIFYFFFVIKYLEYPQLFYKLRPVIKPPKDDLSSKETDIQDNTLEQKLEVWIKEKRFLQQGITIKDLSRELNVKHRTVSFYINVHLQMNFKSWLLYLRQKEQQKKLKESSTQSDSHEIFARFEQLMITEQLYLMPDLQREDAAKMINTNTLYLGTAIRENTGLSFSDYLNCLRLDHARSLLADPIEKQKLISMIAIESGFKSLRTFNRAFKDRFGITPGKGKL